MLVFVFFFCKDGPPPDDLRIRHSNQHVLTLNGDLIQKWLSHGHGRLLPEMTVYKFTVYTEINSFIVLLVTFEFMSLNLILD